ncbi:MAG: undecaprenyldiphospho-muramoylpentapeptide beta-N-acetylglucosaminyltransferase [bacterium]
MSRVLVMAGGTGGHVMPALAVAERLRRLGVEVLWVGTAEGLEARVAPRAGFEFAAIRIKGLRRSGLARVAAMPFMLTWALLQSLWIFLRRRPDSVLGMGGFVSAPGGLICGLLRRPLVVHEQNAVAGLTNRYLARFAGRALSGFPVADGIADATWVGNPVRREIIDIPPPPMRLAGRRGRLRLLIIGGSGGARVFNQHAPELLGRAGASIEVWHQCGKERAAPIADCYRQASVVCTVSGFIDDMAKAYAWCDLILCRAGAMTIAEVCAAGAAALLVPYPHAVNDHQSRNAEYLRARGAARLIEQEAFVRGDWLGDLDALARDRTGLLRMARAARHLARPDAADAVARACVEAIDA